MRETPAIHTEPHNPTYHLLLTPQALLPGYVAVSRKSPSRLTGCRYGRACVNSGYLAVVLAINFRRLHDDPRAATRMARRKCFGAAAFWGRFCGVFWGPLVFSAI